MKLKKLFEVTRNPGQFIDVRIIWLCQMLLFFAVERRRLKSMILQILKNDVKVETVKTLSPSLRDCVDGISVCMYVCMYGGHIHIMF